jgi:predicted methyltransferase
MKAFHIVVAAALAFALGSGSALAADATQPGYIAKAVADKGRPEADRARDGARHPAELMAFAGVMPGWKVADLIPGGGYFTRIFSRVAGAKGRVYAVFPKGFAEYAKSDVATITALAADSAYSNVVLRTTPDDTFGVDEPLDLVWTSLNYHDLQFGLSHDQIIDFDKSIYAALKPGGTFIVIDHVAAPGTGWSVAGTLHRLDPEAIKADMAEAGFVLDGQSDILRNLDDPHTAVVFDPSIRGRTDQMVFRFKKPN